MLHARLFKAGFQDRPLHLRPCLESAEMTAAAAAALTSFVLLFAGHGWL